MNNQENNLDYDSKCKFYSKYFSLDLIPDFKNRIELISAICLLTSRLRNKDKNIKTIDILVKLTGQEKDNSMFYEFLESLSVLSEELSKNCEVSNIYKYEDYSKLTNKIKEILSTWVPF